MVLRFHGAKEIPPPLVSAIKNDLGLFDLRHASRFDQIEAAARALGRRVEVRVA